MCETVVAYVDARLGAPWCGPFHGRQCHRDLKGESCGCGRTGGNLVVGGVQTVFWDVVMGRPVATRWKRPLVKARPAKVKELDLLVNWDSGGLRGVAMPPKHPTAPDACVEVLWHA